MNTTKDNLRDILDGGDAPSTHQTCSDMFSKIYYGKEKIPEIIHGSIEIAYLFHGESNCKGFIALDRQIKCIHHAVNTAVIIFNLTENVSTRAASLLCGASKILVSDDAVFEKTSNFWNKTKDQNFKAIINGFRRPEHLIKLTTAIGEEERKKREHEIIQKKIEHLKEIAQANPVAFAVEAASRIGYMQSDKRSLDIIGREYWRNFSQNPEHIHALCQTTGSLLGKINEKRVPFKKELSDLYQVAWSHLAQHPCYWNTVDAQVNQFA